MASMLKFDSERQAMRRERHEARVARKRERQQARELKHVQQGESARMNRESVSSAGPTPSPDPASVAAREPAVSRQATAAVAESAAVAAAPSTPDTSGAEKRGPLVPRRERDVAAFLARREDVLAVARAEARERITRMGEERAVCDALGALAHSGAAPWRRHRERLAEAIGTGRIPLVGACARRACRGTAGDAARTSRRAPDPQLALAVTVAYAVIADAPWVAVRGARAERSGVTPGHSPTPRAFWR